MENGQLSFFEEITREKRKIYISLDKIYLCTIFFVLAIIVSFSSGVEKGKRTQLRQSESQLAENQEVTSNIPLKVEESSTVEGKKPFAPPVINTPEPKQKEELIQYYSIQIASYKGPNTAQAEANRLEKKGFEPVIIKKGNYIALCVGKFKTKEEARSIVKNLKSYYSDCFIRKL